MFTSLNGRPHGHVAPSGGQDTDLLGVHVGLVSGERHAGRELLLAVAVRTVPGGGEVKANSTMNHHNQWVRNTLYSLLCSFKKTTYFESKQFNAV